MGQLVPVQTRIHSGITSHVQSFPFCLNKKASREVGVIPSSLLVDYHNNLQNYGAGYDNEISLQGALHSLGFSSETSDHGSIGICMIQCGTGIGAKPGCGSRQ